uniref:Nose resistant to fluoxetine protein 6 n=1 Tax=Ascaris suum TaxID=6253 RepID=F1KVE9_ASCSU
MTMRTSLIIVLLYCSNTFCQMDRYERPNNFSANFRNDNAHIQQRNSEVLRQLERSFWMGLASNFLDGIDVSAECNEDLNLIVPCVLQILNETYSNTSGSDCANVILLAALRMIDATGKVEPGILSGRRIFNGLYSECLAIDEVVENKTRHLQGGYGRLFFDIQFRDYSNQNACRISTGDVDEWAYDFCLPRMCSNSKDLLVLGRLIKIGGVCPTCFAMSTDEQARKTDYKTWITVAVLCMIGAASIIGTIYDYFFSKKYEQTAFGKSTIIQCFVAFSIHTNIVGIFSTENAHKSGQIGPIHFMRLVSLVWIATGHVAATAPFLMTNPLDALRIVKDWSTQILTNAYFAVDTFFFMSGLLVAFIWFKGYYRNKRRQMSLLAWIMFYVHRIVRLSPSYYLVIAFYTFVFRTFMKNMPNLLYHFPDSCEENWWINFIYLNNYIDYTNQCYLISWYLATDLQMYIFAPIILIPLAIKPLFGFITALLILLASTAANMATIYKFYFPPSNYALGAMDPRMKDINKYTLLIYGAPWIRCQIYIIGMLTGYLLQTKKELHINRVVNIVLWIISLALGALVVFSLKDWANGVLMGLAARALYSALSKVAWGLALSYITISCFYGYGGPINEFMSWSIWIPLGRLTYSAYLIHYCVLYYFIGMSNVPSTFTNFSFLVVSFILPATAVTYFFAIFWSAIIEISTGKLETIFLGDARNRSQPVPQEIPDKISAHANQSSPQLPHLNPSPSPPPQRRQESIWNFEKSKKSLYKLFKRNEYKSYKPEERPVITKIPKEEKSKADKPEAVPDTSTNGEAHQFAAQGSCELASGIKSPRRRQKEPVDPMETPAVDDWM